MPRNTTKSDKSSKTPPKIVGQTSSESNCNATDDDKESQFELELLWCIEQLQKALASNKMNSKQSHDAVKSLNALKSHNAPMAKKRQIMRLAFGDYRKKMAEQEKEFSKKDRAVEIHVPSPSKNSKFIMRSSCVVKKDLFQSSENGFKFNFDESEQSEEMECSKSNAEKSGYKFRSSDNSFRFNFDETNQD